MIVGDEALPDGEGDSFDADEEAFLAEANPKQRLQKQPTGSKISEKKESGWQGNGLGSGALQQQKKADDKNI